MEPALVLVFAVAKRLMLGFLMILSHPITPLTVLLTMSLPVNDFPVVRDCAKLIKGHSFHFRARLLVGKKTRPEGLIVVFQQSIVRV